MCYGGCDCQRCNPSDEPVQKVSAWTTERPTKAGLFWYRPTSNHEPMIVKTFESLRYPERVYAQAYGEEPTATTLIINWDGEWQPVHLPED